MKKLLILFFLYGTFIDVRAQGPYNMPDNIGSGNCLEFDGVDDFVNIPNIPAYDFGAGDFTAELWLFYDNLTGYISPITSMNAHQSTVGYAISVQGDARIHFFLGCGSSSSPCNGSSFGINTGYTISIATWHHITIVKRGTTMELYDNGNLAASATIPIGVRTLTSSEQIQIGRRYNDNVCCNHDGQIDEVRIWNVARTQAQIRDNMCRQLTGAETGLVGYWNMNEGTGNTVNDLTTNNNHGTRQ